MRGSKYIPSFLLLHHRSQHPAEPFSFTGARGISDRYLIMSLYIYLLMVWHTYALIEVYTYVPMPIYTYLVMFLYNYVSL